MKNIFSKKIFIITGITYLVIAIAYAFGYATHRGGSIIDLGPAFSGIALAMITSPIIIFINCIYILIKMKPKILIFGYLILNIVILGCAYVLMY